MTHSNHTSIPPTTSASSLTRGKRPGRTLPLVVATLATGALTLSGGAALSAAAAPATTGNGAGAVVQAQSGEQVTDYGIYHLAVASDEGDGFTGPGSTGVFTYSTYPNATSDTPIVLQHGQVLTRTLTMPVGLELDGPFAGADQCPTDGNLFGEDELEGGLGTASCSVKDNGDGTHTYTVTQTYGEHVNEWTLSTALNGSSRLKQTGEIPEGSVLTLEQSITDDYTATEGAQRAQTGPIPLASPDDTDTQGTTDTEGDVTADGADTGADTQGDVDADAADSGADTDSNAADSTADTQGDVTADGADTDSNAADSTADTQGDVTADGADTGADTQGDVTADGADTGADTQGDVDADAADSGADSNAADSTSDNHGDADASAADAGSDAGASGTASSGGSASASGTASGTASAQGAADGVSDVMVEITSPRDGQTGISNRPTITGVGTPGVSISLNGRSVATDGGAGSGGGVAMLVAADGTLVAGATNVDADGNWTFRPATALADGLYTLTAIATDAAGDKASDTVTFTVGEATTGTGGGTSATDGDSAD
ncbi:Ig-like domain-containing protein, partial [Isoptericola sp. NPDC057191]|uniref:Ig-like domain-containing protein n=1 Tax=Isoptericola sp. NPDC057191 TaxID=3346041 RepID=UPI003644DA60